MVAALVGCCGLAALDGHSRLGRGSRICDANCGAACFSASLQRPSVGWPACVCREPLERPLGECVVYVGLDLDTTFLAFPPFRFVGVAVVVDLCIFSHDASGCDRRSREYCRAHRVDRATQHWVLGDWVSLRVTESVAPGMGVFACFFWFGLYAFWPGRLASSETRAPGLDLVRARARDMTGHICAEISVSFI